MKQLLIAGLASIALLTGGAALAMTNNNPTQGAGAYLSGSLGGAWTPDITFNGGGAKFKTEYDFGGDGLFAIGYQFNNWRADVSLGYIYNSVDKIKASGSASGGTLNANGHGEAFTYLVNGYYDINTTTNFIPYLGIGLGGAHLNYKDVDAHDSSTEFKGNDNVFAYQGILGLAYQCTPNLRAFVDYHYFKTAQGSFDLNDSNNTSFSVKEKYQSNLFNIGVSYLFSV